MIFGELLQYHVADDRFVGLRTPAACYDVKWSMYWFQTQHARSRFADVLENEGFDVILAEDTIMDANGNYIVLTDFPVLDVREFY